MNLPEGPRANSEIKARLRDLEAAAEIARGLGAGDAGVEQQIDWYFRVPRGRLKLRRSSRTGDQLVIYLRPDEPGPRRADFYRDFFALQTDGQALAPVHGLCQQLTILEWLKLSTFVQSCFSNFIASRIQLLNSFGPLLTTLGY